MAKELEITPMKKIQNGLAAMQGEFAVALPKHIDPEKFIRICRTAIGKTPELQSCEYQSIIVAASLCAQDGLMPDGREAAFVVRNAKVKIDGQTKWVNQCSYMPMVAGIMKRLKQQGAITSIHCDCVYEEDKFIVSMGDNPHIIHEPNPFANRGDFRGVYAIFKKDDEVLHREFMSLADIEEVKKSSTSAKDKNGKDSPYSPWTKFPDEMRRKTVIRRGAKYVILGDEMPAVLDRDNSDYDYDVVPSEQTAIEPPKNVTQAIEQEKVSKELMDNILSDISGFTRRDEVEEYRAMVIENGYSDSVMAEIDKCLNNVKELLMPS